MFKKVALCAITALSITTLFASPPLRESTPLGNAIVPRAVGKGHLKQEFRTNGRGASDIVEIEVDEFGVEVGRREFSGNIIAGTIAEGVDYDRVAQFLKTVRADISFSGHEPTRSFIISFPTESFEDYNYVFEKLFRKGNLFESVHMDQYLDSDLEIVEETTVNDPAFSNEKTWHLQNTGYYGDEYRPQMVVGLDIGAPRGWSIQSSVPDGAIAILDSGVSTVEDLEVLDAGYTYTEGTSTGGGTGGGTGGVINPIGTVELEGYNDAARTAHATMVGSVIAAKANNGIGTTGVILSGKIVDYNIHYLSSNGWKPSASVGADAIKHAADKGIRVVNCSWGSYNMDASVYTKLYNAIVYANNRGTGSTRDGSNPMFVVCSAGNGIDTDGDDKADRTVNNDEEPHYPSDIDLPNVICVTGIHYNGNRVSHHSYGDISVDIAAPGSNIFAAGYDNSYWLVAGTSVAAPQVTAAIALAQQRFPNDTAAQIRARLLNSRRYMPKFETELSNGGCASEGMLSLPRLFSTFSNIPSGENEDWRYANWFGWIEDSDFPWVWHLNLGWVYVSGTNSDNFSFYEDDLGWVLAQSTSYPQMYSHGLGSWVMHLADSSWFFNYNTGGWINILE